MKGTLPCKLVRRARDLEGARGSTFDGVRRTMSILGVRSLSLASLVEDDIVSLVNSSAFNAQLPQSADDHLSVLVAREVGAWAYYAPVEVAIIVKNSASPRATAHKIDGANAWWLTILGVEYPVSGVQNTQIDFRPRVLVAPNNDTGPVHIKEENGALGRALAQDMVFDGQIEVGIATGGDVTLQLIGGVGDSVGKG